MDSIITRGVESILHFPRSKKEHKRSVPRISLPFSPVCSRSSSRSTSIISNLSLEDDASSLKSRATDYTPPTSVPPSPIASPVVKPASQSNPIDNYTIKRTLGTGCLGRVHLAQNRLDNRYYAIKTMDKHNVVQKRQTDHINNERSILHGVSHPFLVNLVETFQDDSHLFFVMEYVQGGELFRILREQKRFNEKTARFYAAQVILALEYLHERDIAYRDIKPENILLDADGHIKIVDFGFAKKVSDVTWTVCGTPDYFAPEIIKSKGYSKAVDWWSLGVLIYEMLVGRPPFEDKHPIELYQKILECRVPWPEDISPEAKDLLQGLLTPDPEKRLGHHSIDDIKSHPFFQGLDFNQVLKRNIDPPFRPEISSASDTSCFARFDEPSVTYGQMRFADPYRSQFPDF
ncbi:Pkinase-domain-containing protein [Lichtheimia hyalospora FSU 10163]|nr:Pkinase-domain-containing protein [Lichtheimia hyalospora FSU 10163]